MALVKLAWNSVSTRTRTSGLYLKAAGKVPDRKKGGGGDSPSNKRQKKISSAVAKAAKKQNDNMTAMAETLAHTQGALSSLSVKTTGTVEPATAPIDGTGQLMLQANASAVKLQGILKKQKQARH